VQLVRRDECVERHVPDLVPVAHECEAAEQIDIRLLRRERNLILHARGLRLGQNLRGKLHVHQHHVGAGVPEFGDALAQQGGVRPERVIAQH
jgi:hypothetical protein